MAEEREREFLLKLLPILQEAIDRIRATGEEGLEDSPAFTASHPALVAPAVPPDTGGLPLASRAAVPSEVVDPDGVR